MSEDDLDYYLSQIGAYFAIMLRDNPDDTYKELYSHYDAVREHIQTLEKTNGWISVKDRMPDQSGKYLIVAVEQGRIRHVTTAMFGTYFYMTGKMTRWRVTHWMPLPELPKEMKRE